LLIENININISARDKINDLSQNTAQDITALLYGVIYKDVIDFFSS